MPPTSAIILLVLGQETYEPNVISVLRDMHHDHPAIVWLDRTEVAWLLWLIGGLPEVPDLIEVAEAFAILDIDPLAWEGL